MYDWGAMNKAVRLETALLGQALLASGVEIVVRRKETGEVVRTARYPEPIGPLRAGETAYLRNAPRPSFRRPDARAASDG